METRLTPNNMIIFPELNDYSHVKTAYKWMWHPFGLLLISYGKSQHSLIYNIYKKSNKDVPDFYEWIRFIHLNKEDFKETHFNEPLLCIRAYDNKNTDNDQILSLINEIGFESKIIFDITNEKLCEITGNYNVHY